MIIWGSGDRGQSTHKLFNKMNINTFAYCDNNKKVQGSVINELKVLSPEEIKAMTENGEDIFIQISFDSADYSDIIEQIKSLGVDKYYITNAQSFNIFNYLNLKDEIELNPKIVNTIEDIFFSRAANSKDKMMITENNSEDKKVDGVIICCPQKTGNVSLKFTFKKHDITYSNTWHSPNALKIFDNNNYRIITAVREPISQIISELYQDISMLRIPFLHKYSEELLTGKGDAQKLFDKYVENIYNKKKSYSNITYFIRNFSNNILDIMKYPFDKEKGYTIIKEGNIEVFVYTLEKMNDVVCEMAEFVGGDFDEWVMGNVGSDKKVAKSYKKAQKELVFTKEFFEGCYGEEYIKHFYTDEQIEKFKDKWRKNIVS